ncbi:MAG: MBL fold metallo-hydrolase [Clostridia bacterium]|nr:MBL fold metallo-hydrolase [Clostridia bacterium]
MDIKVRVCPLTPLMSNCCIITAENGDAAVIDPGSFGNKLRKALEEEGVRELRYILLTHGHFDHISGTQKLKDGYGGQIAVHRLDAVCLKDSEESRASFFGLFSPSFDADILLEDGNRLPFGNGEIEVIHTPGHTVGSVCFKIGEHLFTGDTLFRLSIGRTDFPGGSMDEIMASMKRLKAIEGFHKVYPGHEALTDLDYEKAYNPYMKGI